MWAIALSRPPALWGERVNELIELDVVEIGHGPEGHPLVRPMPHLEAAESARVRERFAAVRRRPHEDVDGVLPALIDERGYGAAAEVVQTPADERKAEGREVVDGGREVQLAQEP